MPSDSGPPGAGPTGTASRRDGAGLGAAGGEGDADTADGAAAGGGGSPPCGRLGYPRRLWLLWLVPQGVTGPLVRPDEFGPAGGQETASAVRRVRHTAQHLGRGGPVRRIQGQAGADGSIQFGRKPGEIEFAPLDVSEKPKRVTVLGIGRAAHDEMEEGRPHRVHVGRNCRRFPASLFRGGEGDGAQGEGRAGQVCGVGDAEVDEARTAQRQQHVARFHVAVHHAGAVQVDERLRHTCGHPPGRGRGEGACVANEYGERRRRYVLGGHPRRISVVVGVHDGHGEDTRHSPGERHFTGEAPTVEPCRVSCGQHGLDCYKPTAQGLSDVDPTHAAGADSTEESVVAEL